MRTTSSTKLSLLVLFGLTISFSYSQRLTSFNPLKTNAKAKEVMQDNEFESDETGQGEYFNCNPLLLNGQSLDYGNFSINSNGELEVIKGDPKSSGIKIPFYIKLRRDGKIINSREMEFLNKELNGIEISKVLTFSKPGDQLIIEPATKVYWRAKRILKVIL